MVYLCEKNKTFCAVKVLQYSELKKEKVPPRKKKKKENLWAHLFFLAGDPRRISMGSLFDARLTLIFFSSKRNN